MVVLNEIKSKTFVNANVWKTGYFAGFHAVEYADGSLRVNLVPSCAVSSRPGDVTYVVARPYAYDLDKNADFLWRLSTVERECRILDQMDRSDRGARRKAYRVLKALVAVEPALAGMSSYIVRTAVKENHPC